jgi:transcriptional regulator with XRE-family HTH domain
MSTSFSFLDTPLSEPRLLVLSHPRVLGAAIAARRTAMGLTVDQAAAHCDVGPRFMRELEAGKLSLQLGRVMAVAHRLGLEFVAASREDLPELASRTGLDLFRSPEPAAPINPTKGRRSRRLPPNAPSKVVS